MRVITRIRLSSPRGITVSLPLCVGLWLCN
uniref:Uncharacterized protein n=1 Tax=Anguilla anguilla TaxID=7936 RepID=A0A0E9S374_ANGAN